MPCLAKYDGYYCTKHQIFPMNFFCGFCVRPLYRANFEIKVMVTCYLQSVPIEWKKSMSLCFSQIDHNVLKMQFLCCRLSWASSICQLSKRQL
jgi:hypothetical protein